MRFCAPPPSSVSGRGRQAAFVMGSVRYPLDLAPEFPKLENRSLGMMFQAWPGRNDGIARTRRPACAKPSEREGVRISAPPSQPLAGARFHGGGSFFWRSARAEARPSDSLGCDIFRPPSHDPVEPIRRPRSRSMVARPVCAFSWPVAGHKRPLRIERGLFSGCP